MGRRRVGEKRNGISSSTVEVRDAGLGSGDFTRDELNKDGFQAADAQVERHPFGQAATGICVHSPTTATRCNSLVSQLLEDGFRLEDHCPICDVLVGIHEQVASAESTIPVVNPPVIASTGQSCYWGLWHLRYAGYTRCPACGFNSGKHPEHVDYSTWSYSQLSDARRQASRLRCKGVDAMDIEWVLMNLCTERYQADKQRKTVTTGSMNISSNNTGTSSGNEGTGSGVTEDIRDQSGDSISATTVILAADPTVGITPINGTGDMGVCVSDVPRLKEVITSQLSTVNVNGSHDSATGTDQMSAINSVHFNDTGGVVLCSTSMVQVPLDAHNSYDHSNHNTHANDTPASIVNRWVLEVFVRANDVCESTVKCELAAAGSNAGANAAEATSVASLTVGQLDCR